MNRRDAVVNLLEADRVLLECIGDEQQPLLQADGAGVRDARDDEVPGILDGRQGTGREVPVEIDRYRLERIR